MMHARRLLSLVLLLALLATQFQPARVVLATSTQVPVSQQDPTPIPTVPADPFDPAMPTPQSIAAPQGEPSSAHVFTPDELASLQSRLFQQVITAVHTAQRPVEIQSSTDAEITQLGVNAVAFDGSTVTVDFSSALHDMDQAATEAILQAIDRSVSDLLLPQGAIDAPNLDYDFLVDGLPLYAPVDPIQTDQSLSERAITGKKIAVNPGHGRYQGSNNSWPYQRGTWWGIIEDLVNLDLGAELHSNLVGVGADSRPLRQFNKSAGNHSSGNPWWQMGTSEYVRNLGAPESVWKPLGLNGINRDIRSRPEYAKWIGADAMVSIHNNGGGSSACNSHGTETWYDTGNGYQEQSRRLATLIQTKLIERIRRDYDPNWCDRGVKGSNGGYGENRHFSGPAALVELAFMDVESDNTALQNARFRTIAVQAIRDAVVEFYGGLGAAFSVQDVWTNDNGGDWGTRKTSFNPGNPIRYVAAVRNASSQTQTAAFTFEATGPSGRIAYWSGNLSQAPGVSWWGISATIPGNAAAGTYTFVTRVTHGGATSSRSVTFTVVAITCTDRYRGEYFNNKTLSGTPSLVRCDGWPLSFDWGNGSPGSGIGSDSFSVRWTARVSFSSGRYNFIAVADDGVRVWIDNNLIIDGWRDQGATEYRNTRDVSGGAHDIRVEYYENGGGAVARFRWETASSGSTNIAAGRPSSASSQENNTYPASKGNDANNSTRWSSRIATNLGTEWWKVDLGTGKTYNRAIVRWENAYAARFFVGWSNDGTNFTGYEFTTSSAGAYNVDLRGARTARYVAVIMYTRAPRMNNYSFYELEVYSQARIIQDLESPFADTIELTPDGDEVTRTLVQPIFIPLVSR